ncbi:MAG: AAA family ATPase [Pseudomonadales bacterium]|nr:AAA family ATPase [Pseudomonadales bacterium]
MGVGKIIFLNGSSSAGKTTLAIMLQQLLDEPYQHIALDQFRDGMPGRYRGLNSPSGTPGHRGLNVVPMEKNGELLTHIRFGDHGEQVLRGMRRAIAAFASAGNNVIIDDLLFRPEYLLDYARALRDIPTWFIGVRCSLDVVNAREKKRTGRFPGTATSHFSAVHAHGAGYDLEVDTSSSTPKACAQQIVTRLGSPPVVLPALLCQVAEDEARR